MLESSQPEMLFAKPCHCYWEEGHPNKCPYQSLDVSLQRIFLHRHFQDFGCWNPPFGPCQVQLPNVILSLRAFKGPETRPAEMYGPSSKAPSPNLPMLPSHLPMLPPHQQKGMIRNDGNQESLISRYFGGGAVNHQLLLKQK